MFLSEKIIKIFSCALFEILYVFKEVNIGGKKKEGRKCQRVETFWKLEIIIYHFDISKLCFYLRFA